MIAYVLPASSGVTFSQNSQGPASSQRSGRNEPSGSDSRSRHRPVAQSIGSRASLSACVRWKRAGALS